MRSEALRGREADIGRLVAEAAELRIRLADRDREARELRADLVAARAQVDEELRSLTVIGRQLEELRVGARGAATRIRLRALREAAELNARLLDLAGEEGESDRDRILDALEDAIDRVAGEWEVEPPSPPRARTAAPALGTPETNGGRARSAAGRGRVSVDIGPFEDFSQLVRFEDAANAIGATGDISIKRFSEGRARIDVALSEPVDLLRELEERCDLEFRVRSQAEDEIVLDVSDDS